MAWNRPTGPVKPVAKKPSAMRGIFAGLVVVAAAAVCLFLFMGKSEKPVEKKVEKKPTAIKEVKPAVTVTNTVKVSDKIPPKEMYMGSEVVSRVVMTNRQTQSIREVIRTADGKSYGITKSKSRSRFQYSSDELLESVLFPPQGGQPPLPMIDSAAINKEFVKSLLDPIVIKDDDTEEDRLRKEAVKAARSRMVELIKEGGSFMEIINEQRAQNDFASEMRLDVIREMRKMRGEGNSEDEVRTNLEKMNAFLESKGIQPIEYTKPRKISTKKEGVPE